MSPFAYEKARLREALKNLQEAWEGFFFLSHGGGC